MKYKELKSEQDFANYWNLTYIRDTLDEVCGGRETASIREARKSIDELAEYLKLELGTSDQEIFE